MRLGRQDGHIFPIRSLKQTQIKVLAALWGGAAGWDRCWREGGGAAVQDVTLYLLYILQAAGVWLQGGGVLHHLVHCDDQEDEIELSEESNGSVNTRRCAQAERQPKHR